MFTENQVKKIRKEQGHIKLKCEKCNSIFSLNDLEDREIKFEQFNKCKNCSDIYKRNLIKYKIKNIKLTKDFLKRLSLT